MLIKLITLNTTYHPLMKVQFKGSSYMSRFANNALLRVRVRVRVWIRESVCTDRVHHFRLLT